LIGQEAAETIALQALGWMITQDDVLTEFLSESGMSVTEFAVSAQEPEFLAAVMDFILMQDDRVQAASEAVNLTPVKFVQARSGLPGGAVPDWT
jgi:Protein of unknown function (DUF3572)